MSLALDPRDELLSTGDAARLLGVSRQHIVNLCDRGDLPVVSTGSHRRVRRSDIEAMTTRLTTDQRRSWMLGVATAARVIEDPDEAWRIGRENLDVMRRAHGHRADRWLDAWERLLDGDVDDIVDALVSRTPHAAELRQNTPFAGLLDQDTRAAVLRTSRR